MIHVYKAGGPWKSGDKEYTIKAIEQNDKSKFLSDGWVLSLDDVKAKRKAKANKDDNEE